MRIYHFAIMAGLEAAVLMLLVLRTKSERKPSSGVLVTGGVCVAVGAWLLFVAHLDFGLYGLVGPFIYVPQRIRFIQSRQLFEVNYVDFLSFTFYVGVLGVAFVLGGMGVIRLRAWARRLLLVVSTITLVLAVLRLVTSSLRLSQNEIFLILLTTVVSLIVLPYLRSRSVKSQFTT